MKKAFVFLSPFLLLFVLSSCVGSVNPLNPLSESIIDERLIGSWYGCDPEARSVDKCGFVHIGKAEDAPHLRAVLVGFDNDKEIDFQSFDLNITQIGKGYYISLPMRDIEPDSSEEENFYILLSYEFQSPDLFNAYMMTNDELIAAAIKEGRLKGEADTIKDNIETRGARITDTPEKLREFLSTVDHKELFEPTMVFSKIPPPELPNTNKSLPAKKAD